MALEVSGVLRVLENLAAYEQDAQFAIEDALEAAAKEAKEYADHHVPVRTGYLKSRTQVGKLEKDIGGVSIELFNDAPYSGFVEFGTVHMRAQPFLTPAMEYGRMRLMNRLRSM